MLGIDERATQSIFTCRSLSLTYPLSLSTRETSNGEMQLRCQSKNCLELNEFIFTPETLGVARGSTIMADGVSL